MRRQAEENRQASKPPSSVNAARPVKGPGAYLTIEELANVGYATPEAAMQTMAWAMMKGTYEQAVESLAPEMQGAETRDPKARSSFEEGQKMFAGSAKGVQLLSKKTISPDRVEIKMKMDALPVPGQPAMPEFVIQAMMRVGDEWKLGGSTREYKETWDQSGDIERLSE